MCNNPRIKQASTFNHPRVVWIIVHAVSSTRNFWKKWKISYRRDGKNCCVLFRVAIPGITVYPLSGQKVRRLTEQHCHVYIACIYIYIYTCMFWEAKRSHSSSRDSVTRKMYLFLANVTNRATNRGRCRFSLEEEGAG